MRAGSGRSHRSELGLEAPRVLRTAILYHLRVVVFRGILVGASAAVAVAIVLCACSSDGENAPVDGSGGSATCAESPCKLTSPQCGCPEGQQCTVHEDLGARICAPEAPSPPGSGEPCDGLCEPGQFCLDTGGQSICHVFCEGDGACEPPGGLCALPLQDPTGEPVADAQLCSINCDPLTSDGCASGTKCVLGQEEEPPGRWFTECITGGSSSHGEACTSWHDCTVGACVNVGGNSRCLDWCDVDSPACPADSSCMSYSSPMEIGGVEYGTCVPIP